MLWENKRKDVGNSAKSKGCETGFRKFQKNAITETSVDFLCSNLIFFVYNCSISFYVKKEEYFQDKVKIIAKRTGLVKVLAVATDLLNTRCKCFNFN